MRAHWRCWRDVAWCRDHVDLFRPASRDFVDLRATKALRICIAKEGLRLHCQLTQTVCGVIRVGGRGGSRGIRQLRSRSLQPKPLIRWNTLFSAASSHIGSSLVGQRGLATVICRLRAYDTSPLSALRSLAASLRNPLSVKINKEDPSTKPSFDPPVNQNHVLLLRRFKYTFLT